jgi:hypothetical protein
LLRSAGLSLRERFSADARCTYNYDDYLVIARYYTANGVAEHQVRIFNG